MIRKGLSFPEPSFFCCIMEVWIYLLVLFHIIIKKRMVNLLKEKLTANEIRYHRYDCITTMCCPSYIPTMRRIHGGTPATAVRSGSRPAPPDSRYLADQKGSGRPLRYRIQAMGEKEVTDCKKIHGHGLVRRGRPLTSQTAFGGQLPYKGSLVRPVARFHHSRFEYNGRPLRATNNEPRPLPRAEGYSRRPVGPSDSHLMN